MSIRTFVKTLARPFARTQPARRAPRLSVELMEDRLVPSAYTLVEIPLTPSDVNARGQVVGRIGNGPAGLWQDGVLTPLGSLAGPGGVSYASAINDSGQVVGWSAVAGGGGTAFVLTPEDADGDGTPDRWFRDSDLDGVNDLMTALPANTAVDINNSGLVAVVRQDGHPALWRSGGLTDVGLMYSIAINDAGQVAGVNGSGFTVLLTPEDTDRDGAPDRWFRDVDSDGVNDLISRLGQWGNTYGGVGLSSDGRVVGLDGYYQFVWTPSEPNGADGSLEYFDGAYRDYFWPVGVNATGRVIGDYAWSTYGEEGGSGGSVALLWQDGEFYSLADLLPADSGWASLYSTRAINDAGWIVGTTTGTLEGTDGFVMIPGPGQLPPKVRVGDAAVTEGHAGTRAVTFTVTLSHASAQTVTVSYATADYTARAGSDYRAASGSLTFAPGETSKQVTVLVYGDRIGEGDETFSLFLSGPVNALMADGDAVGTVTDDEPRVSVNDVTRAEGRKGRTTLFTFTVSLSVAYDQPVTMSFRTQDGSATTGNADYLAKSGTLTFLPGVTAKTITIEVTGDARREANEWFSVNLFDLGDNSWLTDGYGIGTILNDD